MRTAIVGGRLQGVEAAYLARKAGWETVLIDRDPVVPALGLADAFRQIDVTDLNRAMNGLDDVDLIIPALEDDAALRALGVAAGKLGLPLAYDSEAYRVSSSKTASNRLFDRLGLPRPADWPECDMPVVVKPDSASGSRNVRVVETESELAGILTFDSEALVQAFADGPSFSIEVIGLRGMALPLVVTDLHLDPGFDCKRVTAPTILSPRLVDELSGVAVLLAEALDLNGVMDLEVILSADGLKLLEIDARLPSQTPTAVYWSTGLNLVEMLKDVFVDGRLPQVQPKEPAAHVIYEHVEKTGDRLFVAGEHIMTLAGPVAVVEGFCGANEALTDYRPGLDRWRATMIYCGDSLEDARARRRQGLETLVRDFSLTRVVDPGPEGNHDAPVRG